VVFLALVFRAAVFLAALLRAPVFLAPFPLAFLRAVDFDLGRLAALRVAIALSSTYLDSYR
jgi:hypothetical protein